MDPARCGLALGLGIDGTSIKVLNRNGCYSELNVLHYLTEPEYAFMSQPGSGGAEYDGLQGSYTPYAQRPHSSNMADLPYEDLHGSHITYAVPMEQAMLEYSPGSECPSDSRDAVGGAPWEGEDESCSLYCHSSMSVIVRVYIYLSVRVLQQLFCRSLVSVFLYMNQEHSPVRRTPRWPYFSADDAWWLLQA